MSAFLVDPRHIDYMINGALKLGIGGFALKLGAVKLDYMTASKIGTDLWAENFRSVNYRYGGNDASLEYQHSAFAKRLPFDPVVLLKAVDCYEYQTCEHPGWEKSDARRFCAGLRSLAIASLPGYKDAPWGIG